MENVKQVIVIRRDLGMRRGKEIAQGSHASIAFMTNRLQPISPESHDGKLGMIGSFSQAEWQWIQGNFRKITCRVNSEAELLAIAEKAKEHGVTCEVIEDTGLTEFKGVPTITCLAVGPDTDERIDPITGDLELY